MAQKLITDLQLISEISDTLNLPGDDGIQSYRATALQLKNYVLPDGGITLAKLANDVLNKLFPIASIVQMVVPQVPTGFLKCNGAELSRTTYADLYAALVTAQGFTAQTFTVTIATPGVITKTAHGLTGGERLRLSTTGALPTGLDASTDYFVYYIDANTFRLQTFANLLAGTFVNTSGTQSGVHSYTRSLWGLGNGTTTFNAPDLRGVFGRFWDDSRGVDISRSIASYQKFKTGAHSHDLSSGFGMHSHTAGGDYAMRQISTSGWTPNLQQGADSAGVAGTQSVGMQLGGSTGSTVTDTGESAPTNVALMPVIKY